MPSTSYIVAPSPVAAFFEQPILEQRLGQCFFELGCLAAKLLDLVAVGLTGCIPGQALLASLQKLLRPAVVQILVDAFLAAQLGNAGFASQAFQHDPDLVFG